jgi:predicted RNase H-like HicB family nuclease
MLRLRLTNPVPESLAHQSPFPQLHPEFPLKPRIEASQKFLKTPDPYAFKRHPLATSKVVTIDMEYDKDAAAFVTYVKDLHRMSSFGETESAALDNTAEMIRGYIKSTEANRKRIPLTAPKLAELKRLVGLVDVL